MGERLWPYKGSTPDPAMTVMPTSGQIVLTGLMLPQHLLKIKWDDEQKKKEEQERKDKELRATNYPEYYKQQTAVNGCSVPAGSFFGYDPYTAACNRHDIAYGRGGNAWDRFKADAKLAWEITKQDHGDPRRGLVTFAGLAVFGSRNFSYRDKKLPLPKKPGMATSLEEPTE